MASRLAVFDIDGTLTDTADVDSACFAEAIEGEFGIRQFNADWTSYSDFTDSMILEEIFGERFGRAPGAGEAERLVERFVGILERAHRADPTRFAAVPGAPPLIDELRDHTGWRIAVATGGWRRSSRLKLGYAGIDIGDAPLATANDSRSRVEIVRGVIRRAGGDQGQASFERVILVGDTLWDLRTAARLDLPFLAVARGRKADDLRRAGAREVVEDFDDRSRTLELLATVGCPAGNG